VALLLMASHSLFVGVGAGGQAQASQNPGIGPVENIKAERTFAGCGQQARVGHSFRADEVAGIPVECKPL